MTTVKEIMEIMKSLSRTDHMSFEEYSDVYISEFARHTKNVTCCSNDYIYRSSLFITKCSIFFKYQCFFDLLHIVGEYAPDCFNKPSLMESATNGRSMTVLDYAIKHNLVTAIQVLRSYNAKTAEEMGYDKDFWRVGILPEHGHTGCYMDRYARMAF